MVENEKLRASLTEIPLSSPEYPTEWKGISDPPERLYALGNLALLKERKLAIVGSRRTPVNAVKVGQEIAKDASRDFVILTGTADGGDTAAIEGALAGSGRVICLLAGGFSALPQNNLPLLRKVAKRGLLLSPHPFETSVRNFSYEYRNRLLAALSEGVLVLSAGDKSGALITAKYAAEYQRKLFALPYPPNAPSGQGCNRLLKEGGILTEGYADIAAAYGLKADEREKKVALSADEERVFLLFQELLQAHVNELTAKTGFPVFKLRGILSALEVKGVIVSLGGNRFTIV